MKTADNEFTFQSDGERPICVTEFCQPPLDGIHRVHPPEQCCRLSDLKRNLDSLPRIGRQPQRFFQVNERRFPPCLTSARAVRRNRPIRCDAAGGSANARFNRSAATLGAPFSIAS